MTETHIFEARFILQYIFPSNCLSLLHLLHNTKDLHKQDILAYNFKVYLSQVRRLSTFKLTDQDPKREKKKKNKPNKQATNLI